MVSSGATLKIVAGAWHNGKPESVRRILKIKYLGRCKFMVAIGEGSHYHKRIFNTLIISLYSKST